MSSDETALVRIAKHIPIVGLLALCAAGCTTFVQGHPSSSSQFELIVPDAEVWFAVLDRRSEENTRFRQLEESEPRYAYGDDQFFPARLRVAAKYFADAFPKGPTGAQLVIEQLDVIDYVPNPLWLHCVGVLCRFLPRTMTEIDNTVTCHLSGTYAGVAFSVDERISYRESYSPGHGKAVTVALLTAITKAINKVRTERQYLDTLRQQQGEAKAALGGKRR